MNVPRHSRPALEFTTASLLLLAGLGGCATAPKFSQEIAAASALLDSQNYDQAIARLAVAHASTHREHDRLLALAMTIEAALATDQQVLALETVERMRALAPAAFLTWKAIATVELRVGGVDRARAAANAALGRAGFDSQRLWVRDFGLLLDAMVALREGDLMTARRVIESIEHADVQLPAAWLRGRLDAIEAAHTHRGETVRRIGMHEGVRDLWLAAGQNDDLRARVRRHARQIGVAFEPSPFREVDLQARAALIPSPLSIVSLAGAARLVLEHVPHKLRS